MKKEKKLLSAMEVMTMLGISERTLYNWCKTGKIRYIRLPSGHKRYFRSEIEAILKNKWINGDSYLDTCSIQCMKNMRYRRFEPRHLSERENKNRKFLPFREILSGYLIDDWSISNKCSQPFQKRVDLLIFQRYYIQKVKSYYPLLSLKFSIFNSLFFII